MPMCAALLRSWIQLCACLDTCVQTQPAITLNLQPVLAVVLAGACSMQCFEAMKLGARDRQACMDATMTTWMHACMHTLPQLLQCVTLNGSVHRPIQVGKPPG